MNRLTLNLLGSFQLLLDHKVDARFESNKARALLAYLAVEHDAPHPRERLAELLWSAQPLDVVCGNFRRILANLRAVIDDRNRQPPCLLITRETVQFNTASDVFVDLIHFLSLAKTPKTESDWAEHLAQAAALYRGPFLDGFELDACPEFEQWTTAIRSEVALSAAALFCALAEHRYLHADDDAALALYRRCLLIDPYHEAAHRGLMRLLVDHGERSAALLHYSAFRRHILDELDAEPEPQTAELADAIRSGRLVAVGGSQGFVEANPPHIEWLGHECNVESVARTRAKQIALLSECARQTERNRGCIVFIAGESGSGKSALLDAFVHQIRCSDQPWLIGVAACTKLAGIGIPCQPLIDCLLSIFGGGAEIQRWSDAAPPPTAASFLLNRDPGSAEFASSYGYAATHRLAPPFSSLHIQLAHELKRKALCQPVLLALDDLQWADIATLAMLFDLVQRLNESRLLLIGAYRPYFANRDESAHWLNELVQESRQHAEVCLIDLDQVDGREFIDALLDCEPNLFDDRFRRELLLHTEGHALFTVEMLRALCESGQCRRDPAGWRATDSINWELLPPRVEALIRRRVDRLPEIDRALLDAACVEGDEFTAEIAAAVCDLDLKTAIEHLSGALTHHYQMVTAMDMAHLGDRKVARYRFRHHLYRTYLCAALDKVQRSYLQQEVAAQKRSLFIEPPASLSNVATATQSEAPLI
jgi:DNA-binding SARP family transcriptional activator